MTHKLTAFLAFVFVIAMLGLTPAPGHAAEPASGSTSEQAGHQRLAASIFETRRFFDRKPA